MTRIALLFLALLCAPLFAIDIPTSTDPNIIVELVAQEPDILTPTGIAVGEDGRVWCIENNTHFRPPKNYKGFPTDRIQIFSDFAPDGHAKKITTFADGFQNAMNLVLGPAGAVYFVTRSEIMVLRDTKNAGVADEKTVLVKLDTTGNYPHNGLSGLAIGPDGNLYFGMGENLGVPYKLIGSDGTTLAGGGEGGNVFSCRPDGKGLARHSTGYWNPFGLGFDSYGRLFAVDNDPDGRPPCRLMQVIRGGDFGYRFRYGRKGQHPFIAWNGEIPGTLPMISGTGEAPCAVVPCEMPGWPAEMRGDLLVTSWGDHQIQRFKLTHAADGATLTSTPQVFIKGGAEFRPVGLVPAPDGSLLMNDWVSTSYPVHGKGRIWRIRLKQPVADAIKESGVGKLVWSGAKAEGRQARIDGYLKSPVPEERAAMISLLTPSPESEKKILALLQDTSPVVRLEALLNLREKTSAEAVIPLLSSTDPFLFGAAVDALSRLGDPAALQKLDAPAGRTRLGILLALRFSNDPNAKNALAKSFTDADPAVRRAAIQWVGEEKLAEFAAQLEATAQKEMPRDLFEAFVASKAMLSGTAGKIETPEDFMAQVLTDSKQPMPLRVLALKNIRVDHAALAVPKLKEYMAAGDAALREEAIRALAIHSHPDAQAELRVLASDRALAPELCADAVAGLARSAANTPDTRTLLLNLLAENAPALQREALRSLRNAASTPDVEQAVRQFAAKLGDAKAENRAELAEQALFVLKSSGAKPDSLADLAALAGKRPANEAEWSAWLAQPGAAAAGRRLFYHPRGMQCFACHRVNNRGANVGPDLSTIGQAMVREKLVQSILEPSREVAPQFVPWIVTLKNGSVVTGVLLDEHYDGALTLADGQGKVTKIKANDIERRISQKGSLMPDNLIEGLTKQELRDLIAFLSGLKQ